MGCNCGSARRAEDTVTSAQVPVTQEQREQTQAEIDRQSAQNAQRNSRG